MRGHVLVILLAVGGCDCGSSHTRGDGGALALDAGEAGSISVPPDAPIESCEDWEAAVETELEPF